MIVALGVVFQFHCDRYGQIRTDQLSFLVARN